MEKITRLTRLVVCLLLSFAWLLTMFRLSSWIAVAS
jgi:hypothetical protein